MNGWWKFHRAMDRHAVWSLSDGQFKVWIAILNLANHQTQDWWNGTDRVTINPGSFVTSLKNLAVYSHTSIKTVRIALGNLSKIGSITAQIRARRFTEITLVNAETYRGTDLDEGTERGIVGAQQGHSRGTAGALTGEGKEREKKKLPCPAVAGPNGHEAHRVLEWLNTKAGKNFPFSPPNLDLIRCRMKEGTTEHDLKAIISRKVKEWATDEKQRVFLRPKTLFNRTNVANYLGELPGKESDDELPGLRPHDDGGHA